MKRTFDEIEAEMQKMREAVPAKKREAWKKYAGMSVSEIREAWDKTPEGFLIQKDEELDSILERIHSRFTPEMKRWIKKNSGKTAGELREDALKSKEWMKYTEEKYGV